MIFNLNSQPSSVVPESFDHFPGIQIIDSAPFVKPFANHLTWKYFCESPVVCDVVLFTQIFMNVHPICACVLAVGLEVALVFKLENPKEIT